MEAPAPAPATAPAALNAPASAPQPAAIAQEGPGRISGRVLTIEGAPAPGAAVQAAGRNTYGAADSLPPPPAVTVCDDGGAFVLEHLPIDAYAISARTTDGFASRSVSLFDAMPHAETTLILRPGGPIAGTVLADGKPVAGARLAALSHDGDELSRSQGRALTEETGADGAFRFAVLPAKTWEFYVTAPGHAPLPTPGIDVGLEDAVFELGPGAVLEGEIVDVATNSPAGKVAITAQRVNYSVEADRVLSDDSGHFRFDALAAADYVIDVADPLRALESGAVELKVQAKGNPPLELRLAMGAVVRGTLINGNTGTGMAGVRISAYPEGGKGTRRISSPTSEQGAFEFLGLAAGSYRLQPSGLAPGIQGLMRGEVSQLVDLRPGQVLENVELVARPGSTVSGIVVHTDGTPASGADVRASAEKGWQDQTTSAQDGTFTLAGLSGPAEVTLAASLEAVENKYMGPFAVPGEGLHDLRIVLDLPKDGLIAGIVVDERGRPLTAQVSAFQAGRTFPATPGHDATGPDGAFLLPHLCPGLWKLNVRQSMDDQREVAQIQLAAGQQKRGVRLVFEVGQRLSISGKVMDAEGSPLRAHLSAQEISENLDGSRRLSPPRYARADAEGVYAVEGISRGTYSIAARATGYQTALKSGITAGSTGVDLVLKKLPSIGGHVVTEDGHAVTKFEVAVNSPVAMHGFSQFHQVSDSEGRFSLPAQPADSQLLPFVEEDPSPYQTIYVRASGYRPVRQSLDDVPEESWDELLIELQPATARVTGTVLDAYGAPASHASVYFRGRGNDLYPPVTTGPDGSFAIDPAPEDPQPLFASHEHLGYGQVMVELPGQGELNVAIVLTPGGAIEGTVSHDGAPVPGADSVSFRSEIIGGRAAMLDDAGAFRVDNLPAGPVVIEVIMPRAEGGFDPVRIPIEVVSGQVQTVHLDPFSPPPRTSDK
ncbi:MAG: carboxypeptidase regulatory-like domain-containing protein [Candidatus Hydrogenedentes bacterium]|nr:carboxypeptidase regulatory-like domain-containing protein [Candidatus Hydrogenedentota bacterium]